MDDLIVFKNEDGSVGVVTPSPNALKEMTIEQIATKDVPTGKSYRITPRSNFPTDRYFRDAWTDDNPTDTVDIDMVKARKIKEDKLREVRNKKLEELDIETLRGRDVQAEKQVLRDLMANLNLESITDPEELKNFTPDLLKD